MKLLPTESVPRPLGASFPHSWEVRTVPLMEWTGRANGDLLQLAAAHEFDAFVTADQGIEHQQNLDDLPLPVIVLLAVRTRVQELQPLVPQVIDVVTGGLQRRIYRIAKPAADS